LIVAAEATLEEASGVIANGFPAGPAGVDPRRREAPSGTREI